MEPSRTVAITAIYSEQERAQGVLRAFAMITTASSAPLDAKDERMPALLHMDEVGTWLGEDGASAADLKALLRPYDGSLVMREQESARAKPAQRSNETPTLL